MPTVRRVLDIAAYLATIETEGMLLATAARKAGPDAAVPTCAGWVVRDLVLHQGEVHRWATAVVAGALAKPSAVPDDNLGPLPDDAALLSWFDDGHRALLEALRSAPDDLAAFTFLNDAPAPRVFWARRQAHETGIHRVDAESASGAVTPMEPGTAADGIDEMLTGFVPRRHTPLHVDGEQTLAVELTDHAAAWRMTIGEGPASTVRIESGRGVDADCVVRGAAADVHLALWNRRGVEPLAISGDRSVLELFRESVRIRWN